MCRTRGPDLGGRANRIRSHWTDGFVRAEYAPAARGRARICAGVPRPSKKQAPRHRQLAGTWAAHGEKRCGADETHLSSGAILIELGAVEFVAAILFSIWMLGMGVAITLHDPSPSDPVLYSQFQEFTPPPGM